MHTEYKIIQKIKQNQLNNFNHVLSIKSSAALYSITVISCECFQHAQIRYMSAEVAALCTYMSSLTIVKLQFWISINTAIANKMWTHQKASSLNLIYFTTTLKVRSQIPTVNVTDIRPHLLVLEWNKKSGVSIIKVIHNMQKL